MSVRLIAPIAVTEAELTTGTMAETDYPAWASGTTYASGDRVISTTTHRIYESAQAGNTNRNPTTAANRPSWWIEAGATGRHKPFDGRLYDRALGAAGATIQWQIILPAAIDTVAVLNVLGDEVEVRVFNVSGTQVHSQIVNLAAVTPKLTSAVFFGLPGNLGWRVGIYVRGAGIQGVGEIVLGSIRSLGTALVGSAAGFTSYSRNERDDFGNPVVVRRNGADRARIRARCLWSEKGRVLRQLRAQDAVATAYMAGDPNAETGIIVFGYAEEAEIVNETPEQASFELEVLGVP